METLRALNSQNNIKVVSRMLSQRVAHNRQAQTTQDDVDAAKDNTDQLKLIETERKVLSEQLDGLQEERKQLVDSMPRSAPQIEVELMLDEINAATEVAAGLGKEIELTRLELDHASRVQLLSKAALVEQ